MTKEEIGTKLSELRNGRSVDGLSGFAVQSIETGRSSYPVSNLVQYCNSTEAELTMVDTNTDEIFPVKSVWDCHRTINMLMNRYNVDEKLVYRKTGAHYTIPKGKYQPLSINTLLSVCEVLRCNLEIR